MGYLDLSGLALLDLQGGISAGSGRWRVRGAGLTLLEMKRASRRMATAPTMAKTRMTPGSSLAQLRFIRWETAASLRETRDISRAAIAAVEVCLGGRQLELLLNWLCAL